MWECKQTEVHLPGLIYPSVLILTSEVELDHLEVGDSDGRLGDPLLVVVVPLAAQPLGLVPDLDEVLVVLNHDVVLVKLPVHVGLRPALKQTEHFVKRVSISILLESQYCSFHLEYTRRVALHRNAIVAYVSKLSMLKLKNSYC